MKKIIMLLLCVLCVVSGCAVDVHNPTLQFTAKTTIQIATMTYINKNEKSIDTFDIVLDDVISYLEGDITGSTLDSTKERMVTYISGIKELSDVERLAIINISDLIITETIKWQESTLDSYITDETKDILLFCAKSVDTVVKTYKEENE